MKSCKKIAMFLTLCLVLRVNANSFYETNLDLQCNTDFPCSKSIQKRVEFWVAVFSKYGSDQVIFHDAKNPHKVFSTLNTNVGCIKKNKNDYKIIEKERARIKYNLLSMHKTLIKKGTVSAEQQELYRNFIGEDAKEILSSAKRIRCQNGNRSIFAEGLKVYNTYQKNISEILKKQKISQDVQYLPFVESAYNPKAYSRVGAAGMWQIMPSTARNLGLTVNASIDERFDPILASKAAAKYLHNSQKNLKAYLNSLGLSDNNQLGPFIITSYNYGVYGAKKMLRDIGLDYGKVLKSYEGKRSGVAVQNFYSSFLAARYVAINRKKYFPDIPFNELGQFAKKQNSFTLKKVRSAQHIISFFNLNSNEFKDLNPVLTKRVLNGRKNIPVNTAVHIPLSINLTPALLESYWQAPYTDLALLEQKYKVRAGDTVCAIAKDFKVPCKQLISENSLGKRALIRRGQILTIPGKIVASKKIVKGSSAIIKADTYKPFINKKLSSLVYFGPPLPPKLAAKKDQGPADATIEETLHAEGIGEGLFIHREKRSNTKYYSITVEVEETLGHYVEWLKLRNKNTIKNLNHLKSNTIGVDQRLYLPIKGLNIESKIKYFENQRIEFHESLHDRFKEHYNIISLKHYTILSGDSLLAISKKFSVPQWLIRRFNPELRHLGLQKGESLKIPVLKEKVKKN